MAKVSVDTLVLGGTLLPMNRAGTILKDGGLAITGDRITDVDYCHRLRKKYTAERTIDARRTAIIPGLVDTYGHAGHGLIRGLYHPIHGWPAGHLYWHATTDRWWYAEAQLAATERLSFGVTTGASIIGSTPARTDSPIFAIRNAEAYSKVGIRAVLGVGPPDQFIPHIPTPWSGTHFEGGQWFERTFTHEDAVANSVEVIKKWHKGANGRIKIALAPAYLFGRHTNRGRFAYEYKPEDIPVMVERGEEMRELADLYGVQIHTHIFAGSVEFALENFGEETVDGLLGPDVVVAHGNGLSSREVEALGRNQCGVATAPSTAENVWYGYPPIMGLLEAGANVSISTDGSAPRFSFDIFKDIHRAMWHQWMIHGTQTVLPVGKALRMVTIDAARVLGMSDEVGSLEPGKKADVTLVNLDKPHLSPETFVPNLLAYYANGNDVDTVMVDGVILMEKREILSIDREKVMKLAREEAENAFDRVDLEKYKEADHNFWHGIHYEE
ncbi:MAG: amidohydrolase family protein [Candidatus Bathyarchaeota archaeon]|nr:amidohydrolase family protein [Candidatus Bathyarchaeota archaeon]